MNNTNYTTINCQELFARFNDKREAMILVFLLAEADDKGRVNSSICTLAKKLKMHRQTLTRIIRSLCEKGYASWKKTDSPYQHKQLYVTSEMANNVTDGVTNNVTDGVTGDVTDDVTSLQEKNKAITQSEPSTYSNTENESVTTCVTLDVTLGVTDDVTDKKETKENKEEIPPAPPKEEKNKKKKKSPTLPRAHARKIRQDIVGGWTSSLNFS